MKDIGLVAIEGDRGRSTSVARQAAPSARATCCATVDSPREAKRVALAYLQHYREHGEHLERTYAYQERVGLNAVRRAVLDRDQQSALIERFKIAKAACDPDPWRERSRPVHRKQFAELDSEPVDLVSLAQERS